MNPSNSIPGRARIAALWVLSIAAFLGAIPCAKAAPPQTSELRVARENFFFRFARKLEQSSFPEDESKHANSQRRQADTKPNPATGLALPPGYRGTHPTPSAPLSRPPTGSQWRPLPQDLARNESFTPPNFQPNPQPRRMHPTQTSSSPRSSLSLPVPLPAAWSEASVQNQAPAAPVTRLFEPPATPPVRENPGAVVKEKPAAPAAQAPPAFATRVPGPRGYVYPPGEEHGMKEMLDVRDFAAGQKVRDPRTGNVFLVPPN